MAGNSIDITGVYGSKLKLIDETPPEAQETLKSMDLRDVIQNFTVTTEEQTNGQEIVLNFKKKMIDVNALNNETFMDSPNPIIVDSATHIKVTRSNATSPMGMSMTKGHLSRTNSLSSNEPKLERKPSYA